MAHTHRSQPSQKAIFVQHILHCLQLYGWCHLPNPELFVRKKSMSCFTLFIDSMSDYETIYGSVMHLRILISFRVFQKKDFPPRGKICSSIEMLSLSIGYLSFSVTFLLGPWIKASLMGQALHCVVILVLQLSRDIFLVFIARFCIYLVRNLLLCIEHTLFNELTCLLDMAYSNRTETSQMGMRISQI